MCGEIPFLLHHCHPWINCICYDGQWPLVAICNPLLNTVAMCQKLCAMLVVVSYAWGVACSLLCTCSAMKIVFSGFQCNQSLLWAVLPYFPISDFYLRQLFLFIVATFNEVSTLLSILSCYMFIFVITLKIHSAGGHHKVFATCDSHLTSITIFHGAIIFLYWVPNCKNCRHTKCPLCFTQWWSLSWIL